jgi:hypothetical protein
MTVTQEEFLKIFMNPTIDMGTADKSELADVKFELLRPLRYWILKKMGRST